MSADSGMPANTTDSTLSMSFVVVCSLVLFLALGFGVALFMGFFCGRENEYTEIVDRDVEAPECADEQKAITDSEATSEEVSPASSAKSAARKAPLFRKRVVPTPAPEQTPADVLAQEIDYFVRHMEDFYATGFYCGVVVLENHINFADKWKTKSLRDFLRRRPEFKTRSNMSAFKLTSLTPFREPDVQVSGKFQCVNINCRHYWRSLCSYSDHYQKCRLCHAHVYPYEQSSLTESEIEEYLRNPMDENFSDPTDIAFAKKRDAVDILAHTVSPVRPVLSTHYQSGHSLTSAGSTS
jgi:hypothetical protein